MPLKTTLNELAGSEVELVGELPAEEFEAYFKPSLQHLNERTTLDGFRKGHTPADILIKKLGEEAVLEEMASHAIEKLYREVITEHALDAIGRPKITITKLARNNPLGFKIQTAIAPVVTLPDYKKLAREVMNGADDPTEAKDEEVNHTLAELRTQRKNTTARTEGAAEQAELPELTDEFARSLGAFKTVAELQEKIRENISLEKHERNRQKKRVAALEKIVAATKITLPRLLIERETDQMLAEMQYTIESMGLKFDEYLARIKKNTDEMRVENEPSAEKRIKAKLILQKIGAAEKIAVPKEEIDAEV